MTLEGFLKYPALLALAFIITASLIPATQRLARIIGAEDFPGARRIHTAKIPRTGGIAVFFGFHAVCIATFLYPWSHNFDQSLTNTWWIANTWTSAAILLLGLVDDKLQLRWYIKLAGQIAAASVMFFSGFSIDTFQGFELSSELDYCATVVWFLAFINAFNLIDGMDGLATGLAGIAAIGMACFAFLRLLPGDAMVLLGLAGACAAFLRFNFHPAKIFLGDNGSMFLGFTLASIALATSTKSTTIAALGVPLLAVGVPMFDTLLAIWRRSIRRVTDRQQNVPVVSGIMSADMDHLHHRLLKMGLTQSKAALLLYGLSAALVMLGLCSVIFNTRASGLFVLAFVIGNYVIFRHLARVELWDSGSALLNGLSKPTRSLAATLMYPILDGLGLFVAFSISLFLVGYFESTSEFRLVLFSESPLWCVAPFIFLFFSGTYNRVWSRARIAEFALLMISLLAGVLLSTAAFLLIGFDNSRQLITIATLYFALSAFLLTGTRAIPRLVQDLMGLMDQTTAYPHQPAIKQLVYGAGVRGLLFLKLRAFRAHEQGSKTKIVGFIDDDLNLRKRLVHGYKVLGTGLEIPVLVDKYSIDEIVVAATLPEEQLNRLSIFCSRRGLTLRLWHFGDTVLNANAALDQLDQTATIITKQSTGT